MGGALVLCRRCLPPWTHAAERRRNDQQRVPGTSTEGVDAAIRTGIERAAATLRGLDWFEVTEIRGHLVDGQVEHFQVGLKVGFRLDESG